MTDFSRILDEVPAWEKFYTVDEINLHVRDIAAKNPGKVELIDLGSSAGGDPILCLKVGKGKHNALIHGFPNSEEPFGGNLLVFLARALAEHDEETRALDYTWYLIPCSDPDGARLNEGFQKGENTPLNFTLNYYRSPLSSTPECCFPIRWGPLDLDSPTPETKALMKIMDRMELTFVSSLHMMKWGGVTWEVPHACPELYAGLYDSAKRFGVFPRKRPGTTIAPGVMKAEFLTPARGYARLWAGGNDNIEPIQGCYIFEYGQVLNPDLFMMIPECCLWYDPRMWDDRPVDSSLGDSLRYAQERNAEAGSFLLDAWNKVLSLLTTPTPFKAMMEENMAPLIQKYSNVSDPPFNFDERVHGRRATLAEKIGIEGREDLYVMFRCGGFLRALDEEIRRGGGGALRDVREEVYAKLIEYDAHLHATYDVTAHPIRNLVGMSVGSLLHAAEYAKTRQFR